MKIVNLSDVHLGVAALDPMLFYEYIWLPILNRIRSEGINLFVISGDLFHKAFSEDSDAVKVARHMIEDLLKLSKLHKFAIRIIKGTRSHDANMLDYLKDLTKFGAVYKTDVSYLEGRILQKVQNSKEYAISHIKNNDSTLEDDVRSLLNILKTKAELKSDDTDFLIYEVPTLEKIKGYTILFCPEVYDVDDTHMREMFLHRPDICFYHGMIEGALEHYHETNTSLIYNRSITLKQNILNNVRLFTVSGHIHTRVGMVPYVRTENMFSKQRNIKTWYTGSTYSSSFADAGIKKGFDLITIHKDDTFDIEFVESKGSPQYHIINMTKEFRALDIQHLVQMFVQRQNKLQGYIRVDVDYGYLQDSDKIKVEQFKAKFPNITYKVINSKLEAEKEALANSEYKKLIEKPLKELILDMCDGVVSSADYERFFADMEE